MDEPALRQLLDGVRDGTVAVADAVTELSRLPFADLGFARVDHHRALRQGLPEAVYGPGKTAEQCAAIVAELLAGPGDDAVVLTRASPDQLSAALAANPGAQVVGTTAVWRPRPARPARVVVVTAGTADLPVADECAAVLVAHGYEPDRVTDVGVAGLHRLLDQVDRIREAVAVVVVAGMEGALASVLAGLVAVPVVAVPTSVGYGAGFGGVTALLAMHAACVPGIAVVGIDNGYGAACVVARVLGGRAGASP